MWKSSNCKDIDQPVRSFKKNRSGQDQPTPQSDPLGAVCRFMGEWLLVRDIVKYNGHSFS